MDYPADQYKNNSINYDFIFSISIKSFLITLACTIVLLGIKYLYDDIIIKIRLAESKINKEISTNKMDHERKTQELKKQMMEQIITTNELNEKTQNEIREIKKSDTVFSEIVPLLLWTEKKNSNGDLIYNVVRPQCKKQDYEKFDEILLETDTDNYMYKIKSLDADTNDNKSLFDTNDIVNRKKYVLDSLYNIYNNNAHHKGEYPQTNIITQNETRRPEIYNLLNYLGLYFTYLSKTKKYQIINFSITDEYEHRTITQESSYITNLRINYKLINEKYYYRYYVKQANSNYESHSGDFYTLLNSKKIEIDNARGVIFNTLAGFNLNGNNEYVPTDVITSDSYRLNVLNVYKRKIII